MEMLFRISSGHIKLTICTSECIDRNSNTRTKLIIKIIIRISSIPLRPLRRFPSRRITLLIHLSAIKFRDLRKSVPATKTTKTQREKELTTATRKGGIGGGRAHYLLACSGILRPLILPDPNKPRKPQTNPLTVTHDSHARPIFWR